MEAIWKGAFSPFRKVVDDVGLVTLPQMTRDDWRWLDWRNLRPVAKNRIVDAIYNGELIGFLDVRVTNKRAKPRYLWPATRAFVRQYREGTHKFFRNEREPDDIEIESDRTDFVDDAIKRVAKSPAMLEKATGLLLVTGAVEKAKEDYVEWDNREDIEKYLDSLEDIDAAMALLILSFKVASDETIERAIEQAEEELLNA